MDQNQDAFKKLEKSYGPIYFFDLDGTLALVEHRLHYIQDDKPNWDAFFLACSNDRVNRPVATILDTIWESRTGLAPIEHPVICIVSGRSDVARNATLDWLRRHGIHYSVLFMREQGDHTPDHELKRQWLNSLTSKQRRRIVCVFDDRKSVVDMWREEGLTCFQVAEGGF